MRVVAFVDDLMDRSRIRGAIPAVEFIRAVPADLETPDGRGEAIVAVVDGGRAANLGLVEPLTAAGCRVLVFIPHVDVEHADQARRAGATVLSRNRFFHDVAAGIATLDEEPDTGQ